MQNQDGGKDGVIPKGFCFKKGKEGAAFYKVMDFLVIFRCLPVAASSAVVASFSPHCGRLCIGGGGGTEGETYRLIDRVLF